MVAMEDLKKRFGKRIRSIRLAKGLTQEQLAEAIDISLDFMSLIERGRNAPSFKVLERMGKALRMSVRDLFPPD